MGKISIDFKTGTLKKKSDIVVGIDLGTTNSLVAYCSEGTPKIIPMGPNEKHLLPSILYFDEKGQIHFGDAARKNRNNDLSNTIYSVKRLIGKTNAEINLNGSYIGYSLLKGNDDEMAKITVQNKLYSPVEISSLLLKELKKRAETFLNSEVSKVVITVPAYFSDSQRQATRDAGQLAGLEVLRIINEPTAASIAYGLGLDPYDVKTVMIYDLGGGTFDVSILRIEGGIYEVLATHGNNFLGGDDLDIAIATFWQNQFKGNRFDFNELRLLAEEAKVSLSNTPHYRVNYLENTLSLSIEELNSIISVFINKTLDSCLQALKDSKLQLNELNEIILVGGSSRLRLVKEKLWDTFKVPINDYLNPDEVVALGAAVQADILAGNRKDILLLDVTPLTLGIETIGGLMDPIIPRNSKIPLQLAKNYTTSKDGQKKLKISIYQGERNLVVDNILLGEFTLIDMIPMPAGLPKIEIKFGIDADGILSVIAKELRSGVQQKIEINSAWKIDQKDIARRLEESIVFSKSDEIIRSLVTTINEGNYILLNGKRFLEQNETYLTASEKLLIQTLLDQLELSIKSNVKSEIEQSIHLFNESTSPIAHRMMNLQLKSSLGGSTIDKLI